MSTVLTPIAGDKVAVKQSFMLNSHTYIPGDVGIVGDPEPGGIIKIFMMGNRTVQMDQAVFSVYYEITIPAPRQSPPGLTMNNKWNTGDHIRFHSGGTSGRGVKIPFNHCGYIKGFNIQAHSPVLCIVELCVGGTEDFTLDDLNLFAEKMPQGTTASVGSGSPWTAVEYVASVVRDPSMPSIPRGVPVPRPLERWYADTMRNLKQ